MLTSFGPDSTIYAGGTELLIVMKERLAHFPHLIDIKRIPGPRGIAFAAERAELHIGALSTHRDIECSPLVRQHVPALAALAADVANVRVRSAGTIGGNLCFADPHSDPATLLAALDARFTLVSATTSREVSAGSFISGLMETLRRHDELLVTITIPRPAANAGIAYERFKLHERPTAAAAAVVTVENGRIHAARLVVGSVSDRPQRLAAAESALVGQLANEAAALAVAETIRSEVDTVGDAFESESYKRQLTRTVAVRAIGSAIRRATDRERSHHAA